MTDDESYLKKHDIKTLPTAYDNQNNMPLYSQGSIGNQNYGQYSQSLEYEIDKMKLKNESSNGDDIEITFTDNSLENYNIKLPGI